MEPFDWKRMLLGEEGSWLFLLEIAFRTVVMFLVLMLFFKITGKKGIKQLSIFDLMLIIGLGSAAGDPMFYDDVPLLHGLVTFVSILTLYLAITRLSQRSHRMNKWLEGGSRCLISDNRIHLKTLYSEGLNTEELLAELRTQHVSQLGQVDKAFLEASGQISIFYRADEAVIPGLNILPDALAGGTYEVPAPGLYSCIQCGRTDEIKSVGKTGCCPECQCEKWSDTSTARRIA